MRSLAVILAEEKNMQLAWAMDTDGHSEFDVCTAARSSDKDQVARFTNGSGMLAEEISHGRIEPASREDSDVDRCQQ